jgi:AraC-like DNA-binding protein
MPRSNTPKPSGADRHPPLLSTPSTRSSASAFSPNRRPRLPSPAAQRTTRPASLHHGRGHAAQPQDGQTARHENRVGERQHTPAALCGRKAGVGSRLAEATWTTIIERLTDNNNQINQGESDMAKPGEKRLQILQTLAAMLEDPKGEKITTAALAARLGCSEAALYRHFASKAQMFEGLIEFIETSLFGVINQISSRRSARLAAGRTDPRAAAQLRPAQPRHDQGADRRRAGQ